MDKPPFAVAAHIPLMLWFLSLFFGIPTIIVIGTALMSRFHQPFRAWLFGRER